MSDVDGKLTELLADARERGDALVEARDEAFKVCFPAIRALEKALVDALDGEVLRGLPNLGAGSGGVVFYAARVRGGRASEPLPTYAPTKRVLVLRKDGRLAIARRVDLPGSELARDEELLAEDLAAFCALLLAVLKRHLDVSAATEDRYRSLTSAAARVLVMLGPET